MTDTAPPVAAENGDDAGTSPRGRFEIFRPPDELQDVPTKEFLEDIDMAPVADVFDYSKLLDEHDEGEVRAAIGDMLKVVATGSRTTTLFKQEGPEGMSLVHVWFGADFPLFRHAHPAGGDCLYYVVNGSVVLGNQTLGPGSGFFVPNEMPYRYVAGPDGVELLEFRAGGGIPGAPGMTLDEPGLGAVEKLTEKLADAQPKWVVPDTIGSLEPRGDAG